MSGQSESGNSAAVGGQGEGATPPEAQQTPPGDAPGGQGPDKQPAAKGSDDWESKFTAQRQVNRDLESKLNQLRDGLKSALGIEDKKADADTILAGLQQQLASLQRDSLVATVARSHGITDEGDIDILRSAKDEEAMSKLATRLKPSTTATGGQPAGKQQPAVPAVPRGPVVPAHTAGSAPAKPGESARAWLVKQGIKVD